MGGTVLFLCGRQYPERAKVALPDYVHVIEWTGKFFLPGPLWPDFSYITVPLTLELRCWEAGLLCHTAEVCVFKTWSVAGAMAPPIPKKVATSFSAVCMHFTAWMHDILERNFIQCVFMLWCLVTSETQLMCIWADKPGISIWVVLKS